MNESHPSDRRFLIGSLVGAAGVAALAGVAKAGPLTPPAGPVTSTGKTLTSVEPRIDLQNSPASANVTTSGTTEYIINTSGSYYLSANISTTKSIAIQINAAGVRLDLNGFEVAHATSSGTSGVIVGTDSVMVENGSIRGFAVGAEVSGSGPHATIYHHVRVRGCSGTGIRAWEGVTVEGCTAFNCGVGISVQSGSTISNCAVESCSGTSAFSAAQGCILTNCAVTSCTTQYGFQTDISCTLTNCTVSRSTSVRGILAAANCILINCGVNACNTFWGFETQSGCSLTNCVANSNTSSASSSGGFTLGANNTLRQCVANSNQSTNGSPTSTSGMGFNAGSGCTFDGCSAASNKGDGIAGAYCVISRCTANGNQQYGINVSQRAVITDCMTATNTLTGIRVNYVCTVRGCVSSQNGAHGILVEAGGGGEIVNNHCEENGNNSTAAGAGIRILGSFSRVMDNHCYVNWKGIEVVGVVGVVILRNYAAANTNVNFAIASGNKVAVIASAPASAAISGNTGGAGLGTTDPTANISY